MNRLQAAFQH